MPHDSIPLEYVGWWRITKTSYWGAKHLDMLGAALISFGTGRGDRLRVIAILADVNARFVRNGVSFTWAGASELDPIAGTGRARLAKDGRLKGTLVINGGDKSTFLAERTEEPSRTKSRRLSPRCCIPASPRTRMIPDSGSPKWCRMGAAGLRSWPQPC